MLKQVALIITVINTILHGHVTIVIIIIIIMVIMFLQISLVQTNLPFCNKKTENTQWVSDTIGRNFEVIECCDYDDGDDYYDDGSDDTNIQIR